MKTISQALHSARLFAALLPLSAALLAADPTPTPTTAAETPLHEIGALPATPTPPAVVPAAATPAAPTVAKDDDDDSDSDTQVHASKHHSGHRDGDENRVAVGDSVSVGENESVPGNEVSVFGSLWNQGEVGGNAVTVMGASHIDGTVHGNAVVVIGTLRLGSHSHVDGNVVSVGGAIIKSPGCYVGGHTVTLGVLTNGSDDNFASSWWTHGLQMGRPLAFGSHLHLLWIFNACLIALYVLLALAFPVGITRCNETLTHRPGATFLVGVLAVIALPVLFILLCITIVGIPVAIIVLPLAVMAAIMFGKAAIYRLLGGAVIGRGQHAALAVVVGALIVVAIYLVPVAGIIIWIMIAFLGFASVTTTMLAPVKAAVAVTTPIAVAVPLVPPVAAPATPEAPVPGANPSAALLAPGPIESAPLPPPVVPVAPPVGSVPPHIPEAALPRARFWPRMFALLIDAILVGALVHMNDAFLPVLGAYAAVFWKFKGSTVGSIIFGIKVVRIDGRPVDWMTAIVRALACFISLIALGLGFIWIAFDAEKQGWHDKIAGTVVVKLPKGASLV